MTNERVLIVLFYIFSLTISCKEDPINYTCADPLGTDAITLNIDGLRCFLPSYQGCFEFRIDGSTVIIQSVYITGQDPAEAPLIVDVGEVQCLSKVTQRPNDEAWSYVVDAHLKHGYVFKMQDQTLGRLFINSWQTSGGVVTSVNFTWQYSY
jgi:hypothetical protein